ncbi:hypothetical protein GJ496_008591 [Pomphorhynchus laevis]|nr:hypothetical protein GJ496_008591 [Pomphorhynchus laevis]
MNPIYIVIKNRNQQNIHDYDGGEYQIDQESPLCENCIERNSRSLNAYQKINEILNIKLTRKDLLPYEIQLIADLRRANRRWKVRRAIRRYLYRRSLYKDAVMNYYLQNKGVQHSGSDISKYNQPLSGLSQIHENHSKRKQDFEVKWKQSDSIDELIRVAHSTKEPKIKTEPTRSMSFTNILEKLLNDVNSKSTSTSNETDKFTTPELQRHMNKYRIDAIDNEILEATTQYYSLDAINENGTEKLNTDKTSSLEYNQISSTESNVSKKAQTIKLPSSEQIENYGEYDRTSDALISLGDLIQVTSKYDKDTLKAQPVFPVYSDGQPNTISESLKYFSGIEQDKYISSDLMLPTSDYKRDSHTTAIHTSTSSARYEQSYTPLKYHGNHTGSNVDNYDLNISKTTTLSSKHESYTPGIKHEQSYMASKIDNTHSKENDHDSIDFKVEAFDHAQSSIALTQISDPIRNNGQPQSDISSEIYEYYTNSKPSEYNQSDVESLTSDYEQRSRYADTGSNKNDFKPNDYKTATLDYKEDSSTLETKSSTDTTEQQYNTSSLNEFSRGSEKDEYKYSDIMMPTSNSERRLITSSTQTRVSTTKYEQPEKTSEYYKSKSDSNKSYLWKPPKSENKQHSNYLSTNGLALTSRNKLEEYESRYLKPKTSTYAQSYTEKEMITSTSLAVQERYITSENYESDTSHPQDHFILRDFEPSTFDVELGSNTETVPALISTDRRKQSDKSSEIYDNYPPSEIDDYKSSDLKTTLDYDQYPSSSALHTLTHTAVHDRSDMTSEYNESGKGSEHDNYEPSILTPTTNDNELNSSTIKIQQTDNPAIQPDMTDEGYGYHIDSKKTEYKSTDFQTTQSDYEQDYVPSATYKKETSITEFGELNINGKQKEYESRYLKSIPSTYAQSHTEKEMITSTPIAVQERHITSENYESDTSHPQDHFKLRDFEPSTFDVELGSNTETVPDLISTDRREQSDKASEIYDYDPPSENDYYKSSDLKTTLDYDQYPSSSALHTLTHTVLHDRTDMTSEYYESGTGSEHDNYEPSILTPTTNDNELNSSTIKIQQTDNPAIQPDMTDEGYGNHIDNKKTEYKSTDFQTIQSDYERDSVPSAIYGKETSITEFGELNINSKQKEYESRYLKPIASSYAQSYTEKEMITSTPIAVQERHITSENYESDTSHPQDHFILRDFEPSTFDVELGSNTETVQALISTDRREQSDKASNIYDYDPPSEIDEYKSSDFNTTLDYDQYSSSSALHTLTHTAVHDRTDMTSEYYESGTGSEHDDYEPSILTPTTNDNELNSSTIKIQQTDNPAIQPDMTDEGYGYHIDSKKTEYKSTDFQTIQSDYERDSVPSATYGKETSITEFGELNINGKQKEYESRYLKSITSTYAQRYTEKEMITSTPIAVQERYITSENYESNTSHPQDHFKLRDFEPSTFDVELGSNTDTVHDLISTDRREQSDIASNIYDNYPLSEIDDYKSSDFKTTLDYDQYSSSSALHTLTHTAVHDRSDMTSEYYEYGTGSEHDNFSILTPSTNYYEQNLTIDKFQVPLSTVRNEEYDVISEYHDYKSSRLMPTNSNYELGLSTGLAQTTVPTSSIHEQSGISSESYQFGSVSLPIPHDHDQNSSLSPTYIIGSYNDISSFDNIKSSDIKKSQLSFEEDKYVTDSTVLPHEYLNDISTDFRSSLLGRYTNDLSNSESTDVIEFYTNSNSSSSSDSIFANSPTSPKTHEQYLEDISIEKDYVIVSEDKPNFIENFDSSSSYSEDVDIIDLISTDDFEEFPNSIKPSYSGNEYVDNNSNDIYQEFSQSTRMSNYNADSITSLKVNDFSQSIKPLINDDLQSSYFDGVPTAESAKLYSIAQNLRDTTSDIDYNYDEHKLVKTGYAKPIMPEYKLDDLKFNRTVGLTDQDPKISHILSNTKQLLISTEFDRLVDSTLENHQLNINSSVDLMLSTNVSTDTAVLSQTESSELFSTPSTSNQFTGYIGSIQHSKLSATVSTEFDTLLLNSNDDVQSNDHVDSSKQSVDLKLSTTTLGNKAESLTASNNLKNSETSEDHLGDIVDSTERKQYLIDVLAENLDKLSTESNGFTGSALDDVQLNVHSTDNLIIDTTMKRYMPMTTYYSGLIISQTSSKADSTGNDNSSKARTSDLSVSKSVSASSIKEDVLELKRQYASVSELLKMCRNFLYRHLQNVN